MTKALPVNETWVISIWVIRNKVAMEMWVEVFMWIYVFLFFFGGGGTVHTQEQNGWDIG